MNTRQKGAHGEEKAVEHLVQNGFTIISRNYRTKFGEIDCIASDPKDQSIVFVEVKSAMGKKAGNPLYWVTRAKQTQLSRMAQAYLIDHGSTSVRCRFDVIAVSGNDIDHLKNAFYL